MTHLLYIRREYVNMDSAERLDQGRPEHQLNSVESLGRLLKAITI